MTKWILGFTLFGSAMWLLSFMVQSNRDFDYNSRLENRNIADISEFPSQVSLHFLGSHACGATIISESWILTAAHCIEMSFNFLHKVYANSNKWNDNGTAHQVLEIKRHPGFTSSNLTSEDIALIQVEPPFQFSRTARPARLPDHGEDVKSGEKGVVIGWGFDKNGWMSPYLMKMEQVVKSYDECFEIFQPDVPLRRSQLCAEIAEDSKEICTGDSGGPLFVGDTIVGIVSWATNDCEDRDFPGVFTRVASFRNWIKENSGV
ncbi:trypsin-7-like [Neocloeon triangulifer]|uniref:trypsin-7-like n=1 Tax=Neocloeon triangulifer TaxID=2078957 RepID=UPI00286EDE7D|nr:trypsin-7-like [Neocloeon triangulifer]